VNLGLCVQSIVTRIYDKLQPPAREMQQRISLARNFKTVCILAVIPLALREKKSYLTSELYHLFNSHSYVPRITNINP